MAQQPRPLQQPPPPAPPVLQRRECARFQSSRVVFHPYPSNPSSYVATQSNGSTSIDNQSQLKLSVQNFGFYPSEYMNVEYCPPVRPTKRPRRGRAGGRPTPATQPVETWSGTTGGQQDTYSGESFRWFHPPHQASSSSAAVKTSGMNSNNNTEHRSNKHKGPSVDLLCDDVIRLLFSLLPLRDLFRLAFCSKYLMSQVTHSQVVRSAVFAGGFARKNTEEIIGLVKRRAIHVPSPLRLLRLSCGRKCEQISQGCHDFCIGEDGRRIYRRVDTVRPGFGVFLCWECRVALTTQVDPSCQFAVPEERVASHKYYSIRYMWRRPYTDSSGELAGAVVSRVDLARIEEAHLSEEGRKEALQLHLQELDRLHSNAQQQREALLRAYENSERDLAASRKEREERRKVQLEDADTKRLERSRVMIDRLSELVGDAPWRSIVLECTWGLKLRYVDQKTIRTSVRFHCGLVDAMMVPFTRAPTKGTAKNLKSVVERIHKAFRFLYAKVVLDSSFPRSSGCTCSCGAGTVVSGKALQQRQHVPDPFESSLRSYIRQNFTPQTLLAHHRINERFLGLLHENKPFEAQYYRLGRDAFADACAQSVVPTSIPSTDRPVYVSLVQAIWDDISRSIWAVTTDLRWAHGVSQAQFTELRPALAAYLSDPTTSGQFDDETRMRRALEETWKDRSALTCLRGKDFVELLRLHERRYNTMFI